VTAIVAHLRRGAHLLPGVRRRRRLAQLPEGQFVPVDGREEATALVEELSIRRGRATPRAGAYAITIKTVRKPADQIGFAVHPRRRITNKRIRAAFGRLFLWKGLRTWLLVFGARFMAYAMGDVAASIRIGFARGTDRQHLMAQMLLSEKAALETRE
jgi:hypothetical protein